VAVGQNVKRLREAKGLTQQQIAVAADLAVPTVSRIERGATRPDLATLEALAGPLGVTVVDLLESEPEEATA